MARFVQRMSRIVGILCIAGGAVAAAIVIFTPLGGSIYNTYEGFAWSKLLYAIGAVLAGMLLSLPALAISAIVENLEKQTALLESIKNKA